MDDRIALRLGALRLARRRGRTRDAAWAAARLRLAEVTLAPAEARFAREMRVKLGHALRSARIHGARPVGLDVPVPLPLATGRSRRAVVAALMAAVLLFGALLLYVGLQAPTSDPEGQATSAQQTVIATPPPPLRGRTQPGLSAPVALVEVTPAPVNGPPATPGPSGNGTVGGSGGGTGTGSGKGTPAPTASPTPAPSPAPTPTVDPQTLMHVRGRVVDSFTRKGLANVCVSVGIITCQGAPLTDANGFYAVDLYIGRTLNWGISFITPGYSTQTIRIPSRAGTVTAPDIRMRAHP